MLQGCSTGRAQTTCTVSGLKNQRGKRLVTATIYSNIAQANQTLQEAIVRLSANERWLLGLAYYREMSHSESVRPAAADPGTA